MGRNSRRGEAVTRAEELAEKVQWAIDKARNDSQLLDGRNYRPRTWTMCDKALSELVADAEALAEALEQIAVRLVRIDPRDLTLVAEAAQIALAALARYRGEKP